ncbi:MAG: hypothetical protein Q6356_009575 [Candidatus Wukongarchaeota archaeon]|nr:hypothetical protein [Candidatus Wukongarchaeota archaeon]
MPARKMRIELFDTEGNKYKIAFEGQITREKALRLLDLVELLGGMPSSEASPRTISSNELSKYDKVRMIIQKHFPIVWFSSKEVRSAYEQGFKEPVSLSTVSTYLARLTDRGLLLKMKASNHLKYKVASNFPQAALKQQIP